MYRRSLLKQSASSILLAGFSTGWSTAKESRESESIEILDTRVISWKPPLYHGWPTLCRRNNGELLLAFSGGRETHVCPFGRLEWMRSNDSGNTWGWPQVLYDSPIDDRDAGVMETRHGTILVTTFTSLAYEPILDRAEKALPGTPGSFADPKLVLEWQAVHNRLSAEERRSELGCYMLRSTDGGVTWSSRYRVPCNSPHGPISLRDGRLLYAGKSLWGDEKVGYWESTDDGLHWELLSHSPLRPGDDAKHYHELHVVEADDGSLISHIRNHNEPNKNETLQSESRDGGRTWSIPHSIGVWGLPSHLLKIKSGRIVMSYGYRKAPFGIQVRWSDDHGKTWSIPASISEDGAGADLGYPSTVQCDDNTMVTVWYEVLSGSPLAQLRQARWRFR